MDTIILDNKVRYLDTVAICEARHARPKWMLDNDTMKKVAAYISLMMRQWEDMSYMRHTTSSKSNINHFI